MKDCEKINPCGHKCQLKCYNACNSKPCNVTVEKKLTCGHIIELKCSQSVIDFENND